MHFGERWKQLLLGFLTVPCLMGLEPVSMTTAPIAGSCCGVSIHQRGPWEQ